MDISINETVVFDGKIYKCIESNNCSKCDFTYGEGKNTCEVLRCTPSNRRDGKLVIFKEVKNG